MAFPGGPPGPGQRARAMSFYGDLASIGLGDLLQNLEQSQRTGVLALSAGGEDTFIHLKDGKVSMLASASRLPLVESLVRHAVITPKQLESAKSRRRGTRKSLGEALQSTGAISAEKLLDTAKAILTEDLCTLLVRAEGSFRFREGDPPPRVFDPEERRLEIRLPMNPVLLEAARRKDHWELVRRVIPSDSMHFVAVDKDRIPEGIEHPEIAKRMMARLDGTRSVAEVVATFGVHSFIAHCVLAQLVRERAVRAVESEDLARVAGDIKSRDPKRALALVRRARETEPRNPELLALESDLCAAVGDRSGAAAAAKVMAHLHLEKGDKERGRALLEQAIELDPKDSAVRERSLSLAIEEGRTEDAIKEGVALVALHRAPGLHSRAAEVLEKLLALSPESIEIQLEWARSRTAAGDPKTAVAELVKWGKAQVAKERYTEGGRLFEGALDIEPRNEVARRCHEAVKTHRYRERRERNRKFFRRLRVAVASTMLLALFIVEMWARWDYADATSEISEQRLIEQQQYEAVRERVQAIADRYWYTPLRFIELRTQLDSLEARIAERDARKSPANPAPGGKTAGSSHTPGKPAPGKPAG